MLSNRFNVIENHLIVNMFQHDKQYQRVVMTLTETIENYIGARTVVLGGVPKLDISAEGFDTFFLSEGKNEFHKNFVKLLYGFTEKSGEPLIRTSSAGHLAFEHDVQ
jgi:hypothetical protein